MVYSAGNTCSDREAGRSALEMGTLDGGTASDPSECLIEAQIEWPDRLRLAERAVLGFFLSASHTRCTRAFRSLTTCPRTPRRALGAREGVGKQAKDRNHRWGHRRPGH